MKLPGCAFCELIRFLPIRNEVQGVRNKGLFTFETVRHVGWLTAYLGFT